LLRASTVRIDGAVPLAGATVTDAGIVNAQPLGACLPSQDGKVTAVGAAPDQESAPTRRVVAHTIFETKVRIPKLFNLLPYQALHH
jgi:hypothetical protein